MRERYEEVLRIMSSLGFEIGPTIPEDFWNLVMMTLNKFLEEALAHTIKFDHTLIKEE